MTSPSPEEARATQLRHPFTGRFIAGDCERDCLERCAGLCGVNDEEQLP